MGHTHPLNYYLVYVPLAMTFNFISARSGNSDTMPLKPHQNNEKESWKSVRTSPLREKEPEQRQTIYRSAVGH